MAPPPKSNHKGKRRHFSSPEEIQQQLTRLNIEDDVDEEGDEEEDSDDDDVDSDDDKKTPKPKGVSNLIEVQNPNRNPRKLDGDQVILSRREREELQKQQAKERYMKLHAEGKTDQAKADLARLELIRKQREEANQKREMERRQREAKSGKSGTTNATPGPSGPRMTAAKKETQVKTKK